MLVVIINESEGKAWKRTRRVLAKFLPQIGSRVWAGHISEEGLKDLHQEIKKVVSKSGSVVCHRMSGRNRMEMQWIAGQKNFYDEQGRYAFRTLQATKDYSSQPLGPYGELLYLTRCLAALLHDIGKATLAFQGKLRKQYHHEEYRHDLVGFLMLRCKFAADNQPSDSRFLEGLESDVILWPDANQLFSMQEPGLSARQLSNWLAQAPIFTLISWLVLTHHRLPDGLHDLNTQTHINNAVSEFGKVAAKQESQKAASGALPWQDAKWRAHVGGIAKKIAIILKTYPDLSEDLKNQAGDWILANVHYNRPLLIAADHLASIQCNQTEIKRDNATEQTIAYANAYKQGFISYWGDTVPQHLLRVEKLSRKIKTLLQNSEQFRRCQLSKASLATTIIALDSIYYWQQRLAECAAQGLDNKPVFAAILAETGSGKTLAGVRLLHAISPKNELGEPQLRYTLALGLRALTLQSGVALRDQAAIHSDDYVTLVGGLQFNFEPEQPKNTKNDKKTKDDVEQYFGSENAYFQEDESLYAVGGKANLNAEDMAWIDCLDASLPGDKLGKRDRLALFKVVHNWLGGRGLQLLDTPIVACTVDHLVPATHAVNGGDARMALRIYSADLVLDEIDNYSAQDLYTLGKLCFMAGLAGRHVVLMSATMGPFVVDGLFAAWWRGLGIKAKLDAHGFNALSPANINARLIFAGNRHGVEVVCHDIQTKQTFNFSDYYAPYVSAVCADMAANQAHGKKLDILRLTPLAKAQDKAKHLTECIFPEILRGCRQLHQQNAQLAEGVTLSVGFIRFNTAKQAWRYSKWLLERPDTESDDFLYLVVCYHAKHPRLVLGLLDEKLNKLNNRKIGADWQMLPELQTALQDTKQAGRQNLMIIVVTTTLQETGRDHDYDWAILEPRSTRGEVQAAGRVRRHRSGAWPYVNVLIMSQPLRAFEPSYEADKYRNFEMKTVLLWGRPGIETADYLVCQPADDVFTDWFDFLGISYNAGNAKRIDEADSALPIKFWQEQGFDARLCLQAPNKTTYSYDQNPIGVIEHLFNFIKLSRDFDDGEDATPQSLKAYLIDCQHKPILALSKYQITKNRFRESFDKKITIYCYVKDDELSLFEKFYEPDNKGDLHRIENLAPEKGFSALAMQKVLFPAIKQEVLGYFSSQSNKLNYGLQQALFCDLNYYGEMFDQSKIKFHWTLGYCIL
jgi:CRISPR-associated endonuclease/helicase Cas3